MKWYVIRRFAFLLNPIPTSFKTFNKNSESMLDNPLNLLKNCVLERVFMFVCLIPSTGISYINYITTKKWSTLFNIKNKLSWWQLGNEVEQYGFWSTSDKLLSSFLGQFVCMHPIVHMTIEHKVNHDQRMLKEVKYYFKCHTAW